MVVGVLASCILFVVTSSSAGWLLGTVIDSLRGRKETAEIKDTSEEEAI
jgi:hypothetical protein